MGGNLWLILHVLRKRTYMYMYMYICTIYNVCLRTTETIIPNEY